MNINRMSSHALRVLFSIGGHLRENGIASKELLASVRGNSTRWASAVAEETKHEDEGEIKLAPSAIEVCGMRLRVIDSDMCCRS